MAKGYLPERVIHLTMLGLVGPDVEQQIPHRPMTLGHVPILDGNLGRLKSFPLGQLAGLDVGNGQRVRHDGLLLEITDESMAGAGRDEIGEEHAVEEDALGAEDHQTHEPAGLGHLEEGQQMHAFVVRFLE